MKWLVFTLGVVGALVALGILAVDERDVVWEGRQALCPYCRTDLPHLALVCGQCRKSFDWQPHNETCRWCLDRKDAEYLRDLFASIGAEEEPLPGALGALPIAYFKAIEEGACTYCGGLGEVLETGREVPCKVCLGDKRCIGCGGDRLVVLGEPSAYWRARERKELRAEAERRARLTGLPVKRSALLSADIKALTGYMEAESLKDARDRNLLEQARERLEEAFRALADEARNARALGRVPSGS